MTINFQKKCDIVLGSFWKYTWYVVCMFEGRKTKKATRPMPIVRSRETRRRGDHLLSSWHSACMAKMRKIFWSWGSSHMLGHMCEHRVTDWWDGLRFGNGTDFGFWHFPSFHFPTYKINPRQIELISEWNTFWFFLHRVNAISYECSNSCHSGEVWRLWLMVKSVCLLIISRCC